MSPAKCPHEKDHVKKVKPHTKGCEECLKTGDTWVHLRMCLECGKVGCCDSSKNRHATAHFHAEGHPSCARSSPGKTGVGAISTKCMSTSVRFVFDENQRNTGDNQRRADKHPRGHHFPGEEIAERHGNQLD